MHRSAIVGLARVIAGLALAASVIGVAPPAEGSVAALPSGWASALASSPPPSLASGLVSTVSGGGTAVSSVVGSAAATRFASAAGVVVVGGYAYVQDGDAILRVALSGGASTVWAGSPGGTGSPCTDAGSGAGVMFNGTRPGW